MNPYRCLLFFFVFPAMIQAEILPDANRKTPVRSSASRPH